MNRKNNQANLDILLIEDDDVGRNFLVKAMTHDGMNVTPVNTAENALELLRGNSFHAIITDMNTRQYERI